MLKLKIYDTNMVNEIKKLKKSSIEVALPPQYSSSLDLQSFKLHAVFLVFTTE